MAPPEEPQAPRKADRVDVAMSQWKNELPADDVDVMEICLRLKLLVSSAGEKVTSLHREHGLVAGDFDVLATLHRAQSPYSANELRSTLLLSKAGMSARLSRLCTRGLVEESPSSTDRRVKLLSLTSTGTAVLADLLPEHVATEKRALETLSASGQSELLELLRTLARDAELP